MDHDRHFKELLRTFFAEFIELFFPKSTTYLDPVAAALMTKMKIKPQDRPKVMVECLRMIATLKLDPARQSLIHSFMDAYLKLSAEEFEAYNRGIESMPPREREEVMQIVNQWEERGEKRGKQEGIRVGQTAVIVRLLRRKIGKLPMAARAYQ